MGRRHFCGALRRSYDDLYLEYWDGFRFGDSAARAVVEIFANVSYPVVSSGAAGEVGGGKSGCGVAAATAEYVLDADCVDFGSGDEGLYVGWGAPRSHAQAAELVRRGGAGALDSGFTAAARLARIARQDADDGKDVEGESSIGGSARVSDPGAADADQRGDAVEVRRHRMGWGCVVRWRVRRSLLCRCLGCADKSAPHGCQILSALQGLLILLFPRAAFLRRFAADTQH